MCTGGDLPMIAAYCAFSGTTVHVQALLRGAQLVGGSHLPLHKMLGRL